MQYELEKAMRSTQRITSAITACIALLIAAETAVARRPPGPDVTLSAALAATPDERSGRQIYEQRCVQCHQNDAYGRAEQQIPALAGQQYEYLAKQLVDFLDVERTSITMHRILNERGLRAAQSIADVVGYVSNLPMNPAPAKGPGTSPELGKKIFTETCVSCHGRTAEGNPDLWIPNLRGQHYGYLLAQMRQMATGQRRNVSDDLHRMFTTYADADFEAVADYLTRWNEAKEPR